MLQMIRFVLPILLISSAIVAQDFNPIQLPKPDTTGGMPLMLALKNRHSSREFSTDTLTLPALANLLWSACGVNRAADGKRTAPSAMNWQEIDVYVATAHGLFLYDHTKHALLPILSEDIREKTGMQPFVKDAPVNLVYVADMQRINRASEADKNFYSGVDAAFISENVYLYCASEGLATVVRGSVERDALAKAMKLRPDQKVILAQSVGYPQK